MDSDIIKDLTAILESRRSADPESSYVASLYAQGLNRILEKVGEEATEVVLAAKDSTKARDEALIGEVADLWFHTLVMLVHLEQDPQWVLQALTDRLGTSGHVEKRNRGPAGKPNVR